MNMGKRKVRPSRGKVSILFLLGFFLLSCSEDPAPNPEKVSFSFSGSRAGNFYINISDLWSLGGDGSPALIITAVHWKEGKVKGDIITLRLDSKTPYVSDQIFSVDNLNSRVSGTIGINSSIAGNGPGGDTYYIGDSSGYTASDLSFKLSKYEFNYPHTTVKGSFNGKFKNEFGDILYVSNGIVDIDI